jgi:hypothetical protein
METDLQLERRGRDCAVADAESLSGLHHRLILICECLKRPSPDFRVVSRAAVRGSHRLSALRTFDAPMDVLLDRDLPQPI